jgi:hypothetical protein
VEWDGLCGLYAVGDAERFAAHVDLRLVTPGFIAHVDDGLVTKGLGAVLAGSETAHDLVLVVDKRFGLRKVACRR